jgi:hypothetical protein
MSYQAALQSKSLSSFEEAVAAPGVDLSRLTMGEDELFERTFTDIFEMFDAMRAYAKTLGEVVEAIPCDSPPYLGYSVFRPATEAGPEEARLFQIQLQDLSASLKRAKESGKPEDYFHTSHTPTPPERPSDKVPNKVIKAQLFREFMKTAEGALGVIAGNGNIPWHLMASFGSRPLSC